MIYVFPGIGIGKGASIIFDGSTLTEEQKNKAVSIENLPEQEVPVGKMAVIKADKATETVWWDYVDSPAAIEFKELETQIQGLQQAMAELTILLAGGEA